MSKLSRRAFFKLAGVTAAGTAVQAHALAQGQTGSAPAPLPASAHAEPYLFFNADEAAFIEAAVERLIPADDNGPGALDAAVPRFIDRQLAGAWGAGERLYRSGPWEQGEDNQGYQLPFTPSELFRTTLRAIRSDLERAGRGAFNRLTADQQDAYLKRLENGDADLDGVPAKVFFESLLSMTVEGYFSDPVYGGNKDMGAWKMIGFPGAYASFYSLVDQHGMLYTRPPISMGDDGKGVIHLHREEPRQPRKGGK